MQPDRGSRPPDFFIVGAPKSGTTALHTYLRSLPDVFIPSRKDRPYYARDLDFRRWRLTPEEYEADLREGGNPPILGHSCVWYLYSQRAAAEIRAANPAARIVIMLRDPVAMLHAQHSQFLYNGNEDIPDFAAALAAEPDRRRGRRIPRRAHFVQGLWYTDTARYAGQVRRFLDAFGRDRVETIVYDDFRADPHGTAAQVAAWLGSAHTPSETPVVNANRRIRSRRLQTLLIAPPPQLERALHAALPRRLHGRLAPWLIRRNTDTQPRAAVPAAVRDRLERELGDDVRELGRLLGRDLNGWLQAA
jgi:hypothetical protein